MPIGGGHDGFSGSHRIGQSSGYDLSLVQVRGDVDIGSPNYLEQFIALQKPVVEYNVVIDAQFLGPMVQFQTVIFTTVGYGTRMRGSNHEIQYFRM